MLRVDSKGRDVSELPGLWDESDKILIGGKEIPLFIARSIQNFSLQGCVMANNVLALNNVGCQLSIEEFMEITLSTLMHKSEDKPEQPPRGPGW